jgi:hypothetical protein
MPSLPLYTILKWSTLNESTYLSFKPGDARRLIHQVKLRDAFDLDLFLQRGSAMQFFVTTVAATATAAVSILSYAQPTHIETPYINAPQAGMEVTQIISRPKLPIEFAKNLKYIFDHNLLLRDDFYSEANLKDIFNLNEISIVNEDHDISIAANNFSGIFPRKKASELFGGSAPSASLVGGKKRPGSPALVKAGLNFGMDEGGPDFSETFRIFGNEFVRLTPMPSPHGGPPLATATHGNEAWKYELTAGKIKKIMTLSFNPEGELSNVVIEIKLS